jgi:HemX protein
METTRLLLLLSTLAFLGALVHAVIAIRAGQWKESRWHMIPMAVGFALQCAFLYLRGQQHGRCPLTNLFEVFIFIGWSIMLLYFLVGGAYRLSLLGVFTAPLLAIMQTISLLSPLDAPTAPTPHSKVNPWLELHGALALVGYAAFALACITGIMYLLQDRLLKRHRINALFHQLPPIHDLAKAIERMVLLGVILLSISLGAAFKIHIPITNSKMILSWAVWVLYAAILILMWQRRFSARHTALLAIGSFGLVFASIWIVAR